MLQVGNSSVTDITIQRFLETLGAHFIYLQVLNLKSSTAITKQSSSYEVEFNFLNQFRDMPSDITSFGHHILHTNTFVEKSVGLWI